MVVFFVLGWQSVQKWTNQTSCKIKTYIENQSRFLYSLNKRFDIKYKKKINKILDYVEPIVLQLSKIKKIDAVTKKIYVLKWDQAIFSTFGKPICVCTFPEDNCPWVNEHGFISIKFIFIIFNFMLVILWVFFYTKLYPTIILCLSVEIWRINKS